MHIIETECECGRWVVLVTKSEWAHSDDLTPCQPVRPLPVTYVDEVA